MILFFTTGINNKVAESSKFAKEITDCIKRYRNKDWGDLCADDIKMNENAIKFGGRIVAAYHTCEGKVYLITDDALADEWVVTILFADEY